MGNIGCAPFKPFPGLANPHAQTLVGAFWPGPRLLTRVAQVDSAHGDQLRLEAYGPPRARRRLLLLHGLTGSSRAALIRRFLAYFGRRGWLAMALNLRGAGGCLTGVPRLYHAGCSDDLEAVVQQLLPGPPLFLAGFSLGANIVLKWLGERGSDLSEAVLGACAVCSPLSLAACAHRLEANPMSQLYRWALIYRLKQLARAFDARHPGRIDPARLEQIHSFWQFDEWVTAPVHGYASAQAYWESCSSLGFLASIRRPTLLLNAVDDPFLDPSLLPDPTPWVSTEYPPHGGHLGFVPSGRWDWLEARLFAFFSSLG